MIKTQIVDALGLGFTVKVTSRGQLVTAPLEYDDVISRELDLTGTAFNFYGPQDGKAFVVTGLFATANKSVSGTIPAAIVIYEAAAPDTVTESKNLFTILLIKLTDVSILPLNLLVTGGVFLNAKTTDATVNVSIMGYFLDA